ncbi:MAG: DUF2283 domain-containing protein [Promethearchaeota archaeon]
MEFSLDKVADILYILIIRGDVGESEEIAPGIIVDYSNLKQILGLEILNFKSRNIDLKSIKDMLEESTAEEIMPKINFISQVFEGLREANEGKTISTEELLSRVQKWSK